MKCVYMERHILDDYGWKVENDRVPFMRLSRWISIRHNYDPHKRNKLWDYVIDEQGYSPDHCGFNPDGNLVLDYFIYNGQTYALNQFMRVDSPFSPVRYFFEDENGKKSYLSGYDTEAYYNPIYIEFDDEYERVRLYREIR